MPPKPKPKAQTETDESNWPVEYAKIPIDETKNIPPIGVKYPEARIKEENSRFEYAVEVVLKKSELIYHENERIKN